jgi:hypothetical protein
MDIFCHIVHPQSLLDTASHDVASIIYQPHNACHVIRRIVDPRSLSYITWHHDVAQIVCQAHNACQVILFITDPSCIESNDIT